MPTHKLTLEVHKRTSRIPRQVVVRQGEAGTQAIEAEIVNDGSAYTPSLSSVRLDIMRADGKWARVTATKDGSKAKCTLPSEALSSPGLCRLAHFVFFSGTTKAETTEDFELRILPAVDTSAHAEAQSYDDRLTALWEKWDAYERQAEASESARVSAENTRKSQESARVSAENARKEAEEQRKTDEAARKEAESQRANSETSRKSAESSRVTAEAGRVTAESQRATEHASLKTASQQATSAANNAASSADSAANRANGAADDATVAAQNALNIANSIAAIEPPSGDEVTELRAENDVLATRLADVGDAYIVMRETAYMPANRKAGLSSEQLTVNQASVSSETATLN